MRLAYQGDAAVLDLEYGEVLACNEVKGWETVGSTEVLLWTIQSEDRWRFHQLSQAEYGRGNWLGDYEVREVLLRVREGMRYANLDAEGCLPEALIDGMVDGYSVRASDRRAERYVRSLRDDLDRPDAMPDADDFLRVARERLDCVYGAVPDGEGAKG